MCVCVIRVGATITTATTTRTVPTVRAEERVAPLVPRSLSNPTAPRFSLSVRVPLSRSHSDFTHGTANGRLIVPATSTAQFSPCYLQIVRHPTDGRPVISICILHATLLRDLRCNPFYLRLKFGLCSLVLPWFLLGNRMCDWKTGRHVESTEEEKDFFTVSDKHLNYISKLNDRLKKRIIWTRSLIWGRNARLRVAFISFSTKFSSPKEVEVDISVLWW